jgi:hypothetical protein
LFRRRTYLARQRAELLMHLLIHNAQYNLAPVPKKRSFAASPAAMRIANQCSDPSVHKDRTKGSADFDHRFLH